MIFNKKLEFFYLICYFFIKDKRISSSIRGENIYMNKKGKNIFFHLKNSLFTKLFLAFIALFVFCFTLTVILWNSNMSKITEETSASHIYDIIQSSNQRFEEQLSIINSYTDSILDMPETRNVLLRDESYNTELLDYYLISSYNALSGYINGIAILDMNGNIRHAGFPYIPKDYVNTEWFKNALKNKSYNNFFQKRLYGQSVQNLSIARCVSYNNDPIGVILVDLNSSFLPKTFGASRMDGNLRTIITDRQGEILYISSSLITDETAKKIAATSTDSKIYSPRLTEQTFDGVSYMLMAQKSTFTGWSNITFFEKSIMEKNYKSALVSVILYSILFMLSTVIISLLLFNILSKKMYNLTTVISKIDLENIDENLLEFEDNENDEIGLISHKITSMLNKISAQIKEINLLNTEKHSREFQALRAQLNAHFLYNSLNIIVNLAKIQGVSSIKSVTESLIHLLHYSTDPAPGLVKLSDEIDYIKNYISLMKHKFFNNIEIVYDIDENLLDCYTIKMLLQPVVENCVKYAFDDNDGYYILIKMQKRNESDIEIKIVDNGKGIPKNILDTLLKPEFTQSGHLGLSNLEKRIKLSFGEEYGISIFSVEGMQTTVIIEIPLIDKNEFTN